MDRREIEYVIVIAQEKTLSKARIACSFPNRLSADSC